MKLCILVLRSLFSWTTLQRTALSWLFSSLTCPFLESKATMVSSRSILVFLVLQWSRPGAPLYCSHSQWISIMMPFYLQCRPTITVTTHRRQSVIFTNQKTPTLMPGTHIMDSWSTASVLERNSCPLNVSFLAQLWVTESKGKYFATFFFSNVSFINQTLFLSIFCAEYSKSCSKSVNEMCELSIYGNCLAL